MHPLLFLLVKKGNGNNKLREKKYIHIIAQQEMFLNPIFFYSYKIFSISDQGALKRFLPINDILFTKQYNFASSLQWGLAFSWSEHENLTK